MGDKTEKISDTFMELASHQRLQILNRLLINPEKASQIAKTLNTTPQEVARNLDRLEKSGFITKNTKGNYQITSTGSILCSNVLLTEFVVTHKEYLEHHDLSCLSHKFISMLGMLLNSEVVSGYVLVQEKIKSIYQNSEKYVCNMITEVSPDLFDISLNRSSNGVKIQNIFSKSLISTTERAKLVKNESYKKLVQNQSLERKVKNKLDILINLNEKEALLCFPTTEGKYDLSQALYSSDLQFHEWCFDFFKSAWSESHVYVEK